MTEDELTTKGMHLDARPELFKNAALLRNTMTKLEKILWEFLKMKPLGYKFRRQHPISAYILDFYCHSAKLSIEIDGEYHITKAQKEKDLHRTAYLNSIGIKEIRFTNEDVINNLCLVIQKIESTLRAESPLGVGASVDIEPSDP